MPQIDKEEHDECVNIIDTMHEMAHNGAFKNIDLSLLKTFKNFFALLLNVKLSPKQAEEVFPDAGRSKIRNVLYRKILPAKLATKISENTSMVPFGVWKRFLDPKG